MASLLVNPNPSAALRFPKFSNFSPKFQKFNSLSFFTGRKLIFSLRSSYSSDDQIDPSSEPDTSSESGSERPLYVDEWGEKTEPEPEPVSKFSGADPPKDEDEWGGAGVDLGNGSPAGGGGSSGEIEKLWELKRALVDTVYGSDFGFRASSEVRAETSELVSQLEAANPTPAPTESPELLDGNWILVYTAFSELLPLLATGSLPLVKVEKISQSIDTSSLTIENFITLSNPVSQLSFSASASFEVQSPSRIQVEFKEGTFRPPEIKSSIDLPPSFNIFGLNINLSPVQQLLSPLQGAGEVAGRSLSGLSPLKIPIPGGRTKSWLLTTYLDKDIRISRGDGGLFVLVKEGSSLLD
ncbi:probable plastid-lipid-associated protein 3, chloroplastic isoform X2 [Andrographis paniculata]|uniref:probable plastid-lipid-associated protein 3, chloroplastic isoform X2 n=1 Tax=Andrographis paniculata TaxID=175694 RepID=UPI0021E8A448|nr:probable plastid-lipid-associated protein 3, chloroplastic isoform X2 [Andrographis paniculata]